MIVYTSIHYLRQGIYLFYLYCLEEKLSYRLNFEVVVFIVLVLKKTPLTWTACNRPIEILNHLCAEKETKLYCCKQVGP